MPGKQLAVITSYQIDSVTDKLLNTIEVCL